MEGTAVGMVKKTESDTFLRDKEKELPPGIGFTEDTKHTRLATTISNTVTKTAIVYSSENISNFNCTGAVINGDNDDEGKKISTKAASYVSQTKTVVTEERRMNNIHKRHVEDSLNNKSGTCGIFELNGKINSDQVKGIKESEASNVDHTEDTERMADLEESKFRESLESKTKSGTCGIFELDGKINFDQVKCTNESEASNVDHTEDTERMADLKESKFRESLESKTKSGTCGIFELNGKINFDQVKCTNESEASNVDHTEDTEPMADLKESQYRESLESKTIKTEGHENLSDTLPPSEMDFENNTEPPKRFRKGESLSTDDIEDDTIRAIDCVRIVSSDATDCVPDNIPKDELPRVKLEKGGKPQCLLMTDSKKRKVRRSEVYIQHDRATDSALGDRFGASIETVTRIGTNQYEHYLTDIEKDGVADHMKIRQGDRLVLLNGTFVPDLDHEDVLQKIREVPVDSHTRLSLVLLEYTRKKQWLWIDTSAILIPELPKEPSVRYPVYQTSRGSSHETRKLFKLKVPGTYFYVSISEGQVRLELSEFGGNMDKFNICVWTRAQLNEETGSISYSACLYREHPVTKFQNDYVNVSDSAEVSIKNEPEWFGFGLLGRTQSFKVQEHNKWLGCSVSSYCTSAKFCLEKYAFYFDAYEEARKPIDNVDATSSKGTDVDDPYHAGDMIQSKGLIYGSTKSFSNTSTDSGYGHSRAPSNESEYAFIN